jgi:hypothetical protein
MDDSDSDGDDNDDGGKKPVKSVERSTDWATEGNCGCESPWANYARPGQLADHHVRTGGRPLHFIVCFNMCLGTSTNYVTLFLSFFTPPPSRNLRVTPELPKTTPSNAIAYKYRFFVICA